MRAPTIKSLPPVALLLPGVFEGHSDQDTPPCPCHSPSVNIRCTISLLARTLRVSERAVLRRVIRPPPLGKSKFHWEVFQVRPRSWQLEYPSLALCSSQSPPEGALPTKCFPFTSGRGRFTPVPATKAPHLDFPTARHFRVHPSHSEPGWCFVTPRVQVHFRTCVWEVPDRISVVHTLLRAAGTVVAQLLHRLSQEEGMSLTSYMFSMSSPSSMPR